jgi:AbrB family looped-hinge helix DNA binding protein
VAADLAFTRMVGAARRQHMSAVKIGASRQVVIPKRLYDDLGLIPGDYLEVELHDGKLTFTPKTLVDKSSVREPDRSGAAK